MASTMIDWNKDKANVEVSESSDRQETTDREEVGQAQAVLSNGIVEKWWLFEAGAWFTALAALLAVMGLLLSYRGEPVPESMIPRWHIKVMGKTYSYRIHLSINSIISIFSTIYKIAFMIPVAAALAQLKWTWFAEGNRLSDFAIIDKSKGTWGSIVLLWTFRGRRLACLGAIITLAALALDFAFQALVTYPPTRLISAREATVPRAFTYSDFTFGAVSAEARPDFAMTGAMYDGFYGSGRADLTPNCPTGNCTYGPFVSLGVCTQCNDMSAQVQKSCGVIGSVDVPTEHYCNYTIPDGPELMYSDYLSLNRTLLNTTTLTSQASQFNGVGNRIIMMSVLSLNYTDLPQDPSIPLPLRFAAQCMLTFCVKKYQGTSVNGNYTEELLSTFYDNNATVYDFDNGLTITPPVSYYNDSAGKAVSFNVSPRSIQGIGADLGNWFNGVVTGYSRNVPSSEYVRRLYGIVDYNSLQSTFQHMALTMTNCIRTQTHDSSAKPLDYSAPGTATFTVPTVFVQWRWFSLPATLLFLALVFFLATAINSGRSNVTLWKSNPLAVFMHGLTSDGRSQLNQATKVKDLDKIAENIHVKLVETEKGHRLVTGPS